MVKSLIAMVPVVLLASGLVACSTVTPPTKQPGELAAGASEVTIAGSHRCQIDLGHAAVPRARSPPSTPAPRTRALPPRSSSDAGLAAKSVVLRNVGGFSGSYWEGLGDADAGEVTMKGRTYMISGTAIGYNADDPTQRKPEKFSIRVAC